MIFVGSSVSAQQISLKDSTSKASVNLSRLYFSPFSGYRYTFQAIPGNFYVKNLGFFCKQELKLQSTTGIPFKFRVGSVSYCDWMEGKKNAGILPAY